MRDYSIRAKKLVRYAGVYSPFVVYPFGRICDSELISHVFQSTNQPYLITFLSWRIYLIAHTPKNCRLEFICRDFQLSKLIQFRTPPQNAPILPLLCVKFGRFQNRCFSVCFAWSKNPTHGIGNVRTPPTACATSCYGAERQGVVSTYLGYRLKLANCAGSILVHLSLLS
jgi:hypothetical protein